MSVIRFLAQFCPCIRVLVVSLLVWLVDQRLPVRFPR